MRTYSVNQLSVERKSLRPTNPLHSLSPDQTTALKRFIHIGIRDLRDKSRWRATLCWCANAKRNKPACWIHSLVGLVSLLITISEVSMQGASTYSSRCNTWAPIRTNRNTCKKLTALEMRLVQGQRISNKVRIGLSICAIIRFPGVSTSKARSWMHTITSYLIRNALPCQLFPTRGHQYQSKEYPAFTWLEERWQPCKCAIPYHVSFKCSRQNLGALSPC